MKLNKLIKKGRLLLEPKFEENDLPNNVEEQERASKSNLLERKTFRVALISIFTALAVVIGYALVFIPNIELFTLMIFLAGFILGKRDGIVVGLMSSFIFVFFNPFGVSPLPLFAYQLAHYSLVGLCGGLTNCYLSKKEFFKPKDDLYVFPVIVFFAVIGACITFTFDVVTTLIIAVVFYGTLDSFWPVYLLGLPFTTVHLIGNTLGFIFVLPLLIQITYKLLDLD